MKTRPWFVPAVLSVLLLALSLPAWAQTWTPIGPDGGIVTAVVVHPTDPRLVWAGTNGGGVFKSTNGGRAWSPAREGLGSPFVNALVIDPLDPDTLYAEIGYPTLATEVYKTTDGGATWQPAGNGLPPARCCSFDQWLGWLAIDPVRPNILYTGTANGIYKTVNGGASWFRSTRGVGNRFTAALAVDPSSPDTLYVGARRSIWKSVNGGSTWTPSGNGMSGRVQALAIDPRRTRTLYAATDAGLFKSTDAGASWRRLDLGPSFSNVNALAIDPGATSTLYAGTGVGAFKSIDGGATWQISGQAPGPVGILTISPSAPHILFGGSGMSFFANAVPGVFKSADAGAHWAIYRRGMTASLVLELATSPASPAVLYAGTAGQGVLRSDDGGARWQTVNTGLSSLYVYALAVDPRDPRTAYVSVANDLLKTTDGGATWVPRNQGLTDPGGGTATVLSLAVHPQNPSILLAGGDGRVFKSTDGGASWRVVQSDVGGSTVIDLEFAPSSPSIVYAATVAPIVTPPIYPVFLKSTDSGETWSVTSSPDVQSLEALAVDPHDASTLYAAGGGLLYKSTDGAATWAWFLGPDTWIADLAFSPEGILYAGTYEGVFEVSEGGTRWTPLNQGLVNREIIELAVSPGALYAATRGGGVYRMD